MNLIYECPESFWDSWLRLWILFPNCFDALLFWSTVWMWIENLKCVALAVPEIIKIGVLVGEAYSHYYYNGRPGRSNAIRVIKFRDNRQTESSLHHSVIVVIYSILLVYHEVKIYLITACSVWRPTYDCNVCYSKTSAQIRCPTSYRRLAISQSTISLTSGKHSSDRPSTTRSTPTCIIAVVHD